MDVFDKKPSLIFGLGTGGCGSKSLSKLLGMQSGVISTIEMCPFLTWKVDEQGLRDRLFTMETRECECAVDVAFYYLPYVERIMTLVPDAKFICLQRDRDDCIRSLASKMDRINANCYQDVQQEGRRVHTGIYPQLLKYNDEPDMISAIGRYYDEYYETAERFVGDRFQIFNTECLNDPRMVEELLAFVGFCQPEIVSGIRMNVAP